MLELNRIWRRRPFLELSGDNDDDDFDVDDDPVGDGGGDELGSQREDVDAL